MCKLRLSGIVDESIVDGPGIRFVVFVQGCPHNCEGCHNPATHNYNGGYDESIENIFNNIKSNRMISGVTFSGGEPLEQAENLSKLAEKIKTLGLDILVYSGYTMEYILSKLDEKPHWKELLMNCDTLIDGPFILKKRSLELRFRGSSNQRVIDLKRSLTEKLVVEKSEI